MTLDEIDIDLIHPSQFKIKYHEKTVYEKLLASIKLNKQIYPLVVRVIKPEEYQIIDGNTRLLIFRYLNYKNIICCVLENIDEIDAIKISIELNGTHVELDHIEMSKIMAKLLEKYSSEKLCDTFNLMKEQIEDYPNMLNFDWTIFDENDKSQLSFEF